VVEELKVRGRTVQGPPDIGEEEASGKSVYPGRYYNVLGRQRNRHAFLSEKGFVGLGPVGLREGDLIGVFKVGNFLTILRNGAMERTEGDEKECYELVGEAYVHGIMYGELFPEGKEAANELNEREFVLV
jgi:hypothetical protein